MCCGYGLKMCLVIGTEENEIEALIKIINVLLS